MSSPRTPPSPGLASVARWLTALALASGVGCPGPDDEPVPLDLPAQVEILEGGEATVALPAGAAARLRDDTGLLIQSSGEGVLLFAPIGAGGGMLDVERDGATAAVTVAVRALGWSARHVIVGDDGPAAREHGAMLTSVDGSRLFVWGGSGYPNFPDPPFFDDFWQLDQATGSGSSWAVSGEQPASAGSRRAAQAGSVAFLHGGYGPGNAVLDALFRVDVESATITAVEQGAVRPPARSLHAFGYDAHSARLFVFGGVGDGGILGDTWVGQLSADHSAVTWREVDVGAVRPTPRYGAFAGWAPGVARLVVYSGAQLPRGGNSVNASDDAWAFDPDSGRWTDFFPPGAWPEGRRNGCGVVDPETSHLVVFGGTPNAVRNTPGLFLLDLRGEGTWHSLARAGEPPVRSSGFGVALPGGGVACGFGNDDRVYRDAFLLTHTPR